MIWEVLQEFHEGIIALSACLAGEVQKNILRGMYEEGKAAALRYQDIFGKGNFFLELQDHGMQEQQIVNQSLLRMSQASRRVKSWKMKIVCATKAASIILSPKKR